MKVAVLGASLNPTRMSYRVINIMQDRGIEVIAIGRNTGSIGNIEIQKELNKEQDVHTLTLYINPTLQVQFYEDIMALSPQRVIFNPGTENAELTALLDENNIKWENACTLVMLTTNQFA